MPRLALRGLFHHPWPVSPSKDEPFPHSTEDVAALAEVSTGTIYKWWSRGYFVGIETSKSSGVGLGVRRRWSGAVVDRVRQILLLRVAGVSSSQIAKEFAAVDASPPSSSAR